MVLSKFVLFCWLSSLVSAKLVSVNLVSRHGNRASNLRKSHWTLTMCCRCCSDLICFQPPPCGSIVFFYGSHWTIVFSLCLVSSP